LTNPQETDITTIIQRCHQHPSRTGRDRSEQVVAIRRNQWSRSSECAPLTDMTVEDAEREARAHLFAGAIGSYKNPHSHRNVALDDPDEAAEIIMLANHLLRIVDARAEARKP
jgi:Protein of unknown function (Hypoth_ymh)